MFPGGMVAPLVGMMPDMPPEWMPGAEFQPPFCPPFAGPQPFCMPQHK